jgi:hypothetical protein
MDIFLSYAAEQRLVAEEIALALRGEGHSVFFDRSDLPEGDAYNARIREAISACDLLVFLVSPQATAPGRYTLTELAFAADKWPSPAGRVLPVMVQPTEMAAIPAYLRAVVIQRPAGSVAAEVVAAVDRMLKPRWLRLLRRYSAPLILIALSAGAFGAWRGIERWRACERASGLVEEAKLLQDAADRTAAWDRYAAGLGLCPGSEDAARGQERLAMDWLENARATEGKETFTSIADRVQSVLSRAAVAKDDRRAADGLAHLGWADFLRSREGQGGLDPPGYYRQALERDPENPYAHAFWGHYIMVGDGDVDEAGQHFRQALAATGQRAFVRGIQITALLWRRDPELQEEVARIANDMRAQGEDLPAIAGESLVSRFWNEYYDRLVRGNGREEFLAVLPASDHLATYLWLFPAYDNSSNREPFLFMLAQLQERNGDRADALASYQALLSALTARGADSGSMIDAVRRAVQRLRGR